MRDSLSFLPLFTSDRVQQRDIRFYFDTNILSQVQEEGRTRAKACCCCNNNETLEELPTSVLRVAKEVVFRSSFNSRTVCALAQALYSASAIFKDASRKVQQRCHYYSGNASYFIDNVHRIIVLTFSFQRVYRGAKARAYASVERSHRAAAITIQTFRRKCKAQEHLRIMKRNELAAIRIQTAWRCYFERVEFLYALDSASRIQRLIRGFMTRSLVSRKNSAALIIQRTWWSCVDRWDSEGATTLIQAQWRGFLARQIYAAKVEEYLAAQTIQRLWRGFQCLREYRRGRVAAICIQTRFRGVQTRKTVDVALYRKAALKIQNIWRAFSAQVQYQLDVLDIVTVQSLARRMSAIAESKRRRRAVVVLQGTVRCSLARRARSNLLKERINAAACVIQISWAHYKKRCARESAAICIQQWWQSFQCQQAYLQMKTAALLCQGQIRAYLQRRSFLKLRRSAIVLQSQWRSFSASLNFQADMLEVVICQSIVRRFFARRKARSCRVAVLRIQNFCRQQNASRCVKEMMKRQQHLELLSRSATTLQVCI